MSAVVNNNLDGLLSSIIGFGDGGSSGLTSTIKGLNLDSVIGASGGNSGSLLSSLGGLSSLLGPVGSGLSMVSNLIPGLDGFLKNGYDFTCLGSQAFNKGNLDEQLNILKAKSDLAQRDGGVTEIARLLNWCAENVVMSDIEIAKYKSGCSKSLRGKFRQACQDVIDSIPKDNFNVVSSNGKNWDGASFTYVGYQPKNASMQMVGQVPQVTLEQFQNELVPQVKAYAMQNGLNPDEAVQKAYSNLFPNGGIFGTGTITLGNEGVDWEVNASNKQKDYTNILLVAVAGLVAFMFFKKK